MGTTPQTKINQLLQALPPRAVYLSSWMKLKNISNDLQHRYIKSAWLTPIGTGAMIRTGDTPTLYGAMYSLNTQADKHLTIGAMSALEIHGYSQPPDGQANRFAVCATKGVFTALVQKIRLGSYAPAVYHRNIQFRHRNHHHPTRSFRVADLYPGAGIYGVSAPRTTVLRHYRPLLCDGNAVDTPAEECTTTVGGVPFRQSEAAVPLYGRKGPSCVVRGPRPRQNRPRQWQTGNRQRGRLR